MGTAVEEAPVATETKTRRPDDLVLEKFQDRAGYKRKIIPLFVQDGVSYFRVNYMHEVEWKLIECYWVKVIEGRVFSAKEVPGKKTE